MEWNEVSFQARVSLETFDLDKLKKSSISLCDYISINSLTGTCSGTGTATDAIDLKKRVDEMISVAERFSNFRK
jgi:hypothetical protein